MGIPDPPAANRQPPLPLLDPMLAVTVPSLPSDQDRWAFEAKLDGFRATCLIDHGQVRVRSRTGKPMHPWLPELTAVRHALPGRRLILDGELVALVDGRPSIAALQQRMRTRRPTTTGVPVLMAVFDLLFVDDELLIRRPYRQRRTLLENLELPSSAFQVIPAAAGAGQAMLAAVRQQDLEGVVAKRLGSPYRPGVI